MAEESVPETIHARKRKAIALARDGQYEQAKAAFESVRPDCPDDEEILLHLGFVYQQLRRYKEAIAIYQQMAGRNPHSSDIYNNLGAAQELDGDFAAAAEAYERAIETAPSNFSALFNLGNLCRQRGRLTEAIEYLRKARMFRPQEPDILVTLGAALNAIGERREAEQLCRTAIEFNPESPVAHCVLGVILQGGGNLTDALQSYRRALEIDPANTQAAMNLGSAHMAQGDAVEAGRVYSKALEIRPDYAGAHSNALFALNYYNEMPDELFTAHKRWGEQQARNVEPEDLPRPAPPSSRLRVGYISPDFRTHSVACFFEPILRHHNRHEFEIVCYSDVLKPDHTTARLQEMAGLWREITGLSDHEVSKQILNDNIDILVDLAGHTAHNRMGVFARKPARIQVTYLGYPNTTGLRTIDYRLVDTWTDPAGADAWHSEELVRLPQGFLCYQPPGKTPPINEPPCLKNGYVTFGSFNVLAKISPGAVRCWSEILRLAPDSALFLKCTGLMDAASRNRLYSMFRDYSIAPERLRFMGRVTRMEDHLALYNQVDIALDSFPYNGTTTTCEALWMGVPVIVLKGRMHAGRVGWSLLNQVGLPELAAADQNGYVRVAVDLATDSERLGNYRSGLRERISRSPLYNAAGFVRNLENAYQEMWKRALRDE